jgi:hypothetical protein
MINVMSHGQMHFEICYFLPTLFEQIFNAYMKFITVNGLLAQKKNPEKYFILPKNATFFSQPSTKESD